MFGILSQIPANYTWLICIICLRILWKILTLYDAGTKAYEGCKRKKRLRLTSEDVLHDYIGKHVFLHNCRKTRVLLHFREIEG